jgi:hypothetical protein
MANELYSMGQWAKLARKRVDAYMRHLTRGSNSTEHRSLRWREVRRCGVMAEAAAMQDLGLAWMPCQPTPTDPAERYMVQLVGTDLLLHRIAGCSSWWLMSTATACALWRLQVQGELVADLRQPVPHWAVVVEQSTNRSRADSLLRTDHRINQSNWPDGGQARAA